jgi:hypothetical protein
MAWTKSLPHPGHIALPFISIFNIFIPNLFIIFASNIFATFKLMHG